MDALPSLPTVLEQTAKKARYSFRHLRHLPDFDDQLQTANLYAIAHYRSCQQRGKSFSAGLIAHFAVKRAAARTGERRDLLSWRSDARRGLSVVRVGFGFCESQRTDDAPTLLAAIARDGEDEGHRIDCRRWLASLPQRTRRILVLLMAGHTSTEIGQRLGMTARNVNRIRVKIRRQAKSHFGLATPAPSP